MLDQNKFLTKTFDFDNFRQTLHFSIFDKTFSETVRWPFSLKIFRKLNEIFDTEFLDLPKSIFAKI